MPRVAPLAVIALLSLSGVASADSFEKAAALRQALAVLQDASSRKAGVCSRPVHPAPLMCQAAVAATSRL